MRKLNNPNKSLKKMKGKRLNVLINFNKSKKK